MIAGKIYCISNKKLGYWSILKYGKIKRTLLKLQLELSKTSARRMQLGTERTVKFLISRFSWELTFLGKPYINTSLLFILLLCGLTGHSNMQCNTTVTCLQGTVRRWRQTSGQKQELKSPCKRVSHEHSPPRSPGNLK